MLAKVNKYERKESMRVCGPILIVETPWKRQDRTKRLLARAWHEQEDSRDLMCCAKVGQDHDRSHHTTPHSY